MPTFAFNESLDVESLKTAFSRTGRIQVPNFLLPESAVALFRYLAATSEWRLTANRGEQVVDLGASALAALTQEQQLKLNKAITLGGRYGFQFCYETIRLPKEPPGSEDAMTPLAEFERFLSSDVAMSLLRTITGLDGIDFADAHASRYLANHFLTAHDDASEEMGRRAAYVLNLSPDWRADWGGLLLFHDERGNICEGFTPTFNTLNLFSVPQRHSVSWVTPLSPHPRLAVTGWLRSRNSDLY